MSESTAAAGCTEAEWKAARKAGLLFADLGSTTQERAIHAFAEIVRGAHLTEPPLVDRCVPLSDEQLVAIRDEHLPNQGEPFDCIAFARAIQAASPAPRYTKEMGAAAERYLYRTNRFAHPLPEQWRWEECWNAMVAAHADDEGNAAPQFDAPGHPGARYTWGAR